MSGIFGTTDAPTVDDPVDMMQPYPTTKLAPVLYGLNGNIANSPRNFSDTAFVDAIADLKPKLIRVPGGSVPFSLLTYAYETGQTNKPEDFSNLPKKAIDVVFVLQMVDYELKQNIAWLAKAESLGVPIKYIELGNEYNNRSNPGRAKFKTASNYANTCRMWIAELRKKWPNAFYACIGENKGYADDTARWNSTVLAANPDVALTWHVYPNPNEYARNGIVDFARLEALIDYDYRVAGFDKVSNWWATEFNPVKDTDKEGETAYVASDQHALAVPFVANKLKSLGGRIMCMHNVVGKVGALNVTKNEISLLPSGEGFKNIVQ